MHTIKSAQVHELKSSYFVVKKSEMFPSLQADHVLHLCRAKTFETKRRSLKNRKKGIRRRTK